VIDTHGESHRAACEARTVMRWPAHERKDLYARVAKARGQAAAAALIADVNREWKKASVRDVE
jgi:hypothetical protein